MYSLAMLNPVKSILRSVALLLLGNGLLNTLLTLRGTAEGFSSAVLGIIMSGYFVGFICGTWVSGRLIRRMGHIRTFGFSDKHDRPKVMIWVVLLAALTAAAMPFAPSHEVLLGLYFIWGGLAFSLYPLAVAQLIKLRVKPRPFRPGKDSAASPRMPLLTFCTVLYYPCRHDLPRGTRKVTSVETA
ncbi:hypothetical protein [Vreelandella stevensii]|uniref:hypothetical protein n=1 Tax=Vreelandella stevensii TaxID=502821 RepID=UPI000309FB82|nr:hypothetical protein [Halomonas stevensii]